LELRNIKSVAEKHNVSYHRLRNWMIEGFVEANSDNTIPTSQDEKIQYVLQVFEEAKSKGTRVTNEEVKQMLLEKFSLKAREEEEAEKKQEIILTSAVETSFKKMGLDEIMIEFAERSKHFVTKEEMQLFAESIKSAVNESIAEKIQLLEDPEKAKQTELIESLQNQNQIMFSKLEDTTEALAKATERLESVEKMLQTNKSNKSIWSKLFGK
jgi:hypothetical protein